MRHLALICPLLFLPVAGFAQTDDRGYLTALLEDNLSSENQKVTITGFQGALSSQARMAELTIADPDGAWLTLRDVVLDWNRAALLTGNVSVNQLTASEIILDRLPPADDSGPAPEARPFALPELPVSVKINRIAADRIVVGAPVLGTAIEGRLSASANLAGGEGTISLNLERTDDGPDGVFALTAGYANATRRLLVDLDAREDAGGLAATLLGIPGAPALDLTAKGDGPIDDFTADLALASDGQERLSGTVALKTTETGGQGFRIDLGGDIAPLFLPDYAAFFGDDIRLSADGARAETGRVDLHALSLQSRAVVLGGSATIAPDGLPEKLKLDVQIGSPDGQPVRLPFATDARTALRDAALQLDFDATQGDGWRLEGTVNGLSRSDVSADRLTLNASGRINRGAGTGARPVVGGTVRFGAEGLLPADPALAALTGTAAQGTATFFWQEGSDALHLPQLSLAGDGYALQGGARIAGLDNALAITGRAEAEVADLSRASLLAGRPLSGAARLRGEGSGSPLSGAFDVTATVQGSDLAIGPTELDNLLRGTSMLSASVLRDEAGTRIRTLNVTAQTLSAEIAGLYASAGSDLTAQLAFRDLSVLGNGFGGALQGSARFTGLPEDGRVTVEATGQDLRIGQAEADALLRGESNVSLAAQLNGGGADIERLNVTARALVAAITGRLDPEASELAATLRLSDLSALGGGYRGSAEVQATAKGKPGDARITVTGTSQDLAIGQPEADTLLRGRSDLSATVALVGENIRVEAANLSNPQVTARADGAIAGDVRTLGLEMRLANLALLLPDFPGPVTVQGTAAENTLGYAVDLAVRGPGGIDAQIAGRVDNRLRADGLRLSGSAQAALANPFLRPRSVSGPVSFDLVLNGAFAPEAISGRVTLANGQIADPGLAFSLQGLGVQANLTPGRVAFSGLGNVSTGGTLAFSGDVGLAPPFDGTIESRLTGVILRDPLLYETRLNGTLAMRGPLTGGAIISGDITLLETELRVPSTGMTGYGDVPGLVHVNEPAAVRNTRRRAGLVEDGGADATGPSRPFGLDLTVSAPNRLFIRGRGLDAELGGTLTLAGTTDAIVPSGAFELVRGRLDILGKRLNLSEATLQLEGDFNPILRILASTESDGITASVSIEGPADEPVVSFVSAPELPEEEVLARLLFDRGLTSLSALQAVQLASAVATLAGKGGEGMVSKLRKGIGLDDLDIVTDGDGGTSVRAGKYISRNVYTQVEVNERGESEISLNLDVTSNITVRGTAGAEDTSIGVFLEKDY